jgi:tetratricopeptide (TPR) repeat protein
MKKHFATTALVLLFVCFTFPSLSKAEVNKALSIELNEKAVALAKTRDYTRAERLFKDSLEADNGNLTAAFNLAGMYVANRKPEDAVALLEHYAAENPNDVGILIRLGDAFMANRNASAALVNYKKAFQLEAGYEGLPLKLATAHVLNNELPEAEKVLLHGVELEPDNYELLTNLSSVFLANGNPDKAISTVRRALQIKASSELYITMGTAYEIRNEIRNALIAFQRAADLGNNTDELKQKIASLQDELKRNETT